MPAELKNRAKMLRAKRYAAACHEAAHAVICLHVGQTFKCIRLREEPRWTRGSITAKSLGQLIPTDETVYRSAALKEVQVALAGLAFEKLLRPHLTFFLLSAFAQAAGDYEDAMEWCRYFLPTGATSTDVDKVIFKQLYPAVRKLVLAKWGKIAAVGDVLARCGELNQEQVEAILEPKRKAAKAGWQSRYC
jgi:hypothetical protein